MSMAPLEKAAQARPASARVPLLNGKRALLYVVCSPRRRVGMTLLSRLIVELQIIEGRPVAAFDLGDEEPQLADFIDCTVGDISDVVGQMRFFDALIADSVSLKVVDVSQRLFRDFFVVVQKIGLFEEARRRGIEPIILFMVDPDPKSAKAYSILRRWFADAMMVPVRNHMVARGMNLDDDFPIVGPAPVTPEIPELGAPLKTLLDQRSFSFAKFWHGQLERFPARLDDELRPWMKRVSFQFRQIELSLICEDVLSSLQPKTRAATARASQG